MKHPTFTQQSADQPLLNTYAFLRSLLMWAVAWAGVVLFITYQGQPGIIFLTPLAWGLAVPAGLNYVALSNGQPGKRPFWIGVLLGALLGLIYGLLFLVIGVATMPDDDPSTGRLGMWQISLILGGMGVVICALLGGLMAARAAYLQRRGKQLLVIEANL